MRWIKSTPFSQALGIVLEAMIESIDMALTVSQDYDINEETPLDPPSYRGCIADLDYYSAPYATIPEAQADAERKAGELIRAALAELALAGVPQCS